MDPLTRYTIDCSRSVVLVESETGYLVRYIDADTEIRRLRALLRLIERQLPSPYDYPENIGQVTKLFDRIWEICRDIKGKRPAVSATLKHE